MRLLLTGGSGYLGQFLIGLHHLCEELVYTYASRELPGTPANVHGVKVDLVSGEGLQAAFAQPIHVVINCAAMSQPAQCEKEPDHARALNVPTHLVSALEQQRAACGVEALLVHLSTDQVYDGSRAAWAEGDPALPVNEYGRTKLAAEQLLQDRWPKHVILRSSIIYGRTPPYAPVPRQLFLQFIDGALQEGKPVTFFHDEFRNPVYVRDIVRVAARLCELAGQAGPAAGSSGTADGSSGTGDGCSAGGTAQQAGGQCEAGAAGDGTAAVFGRVFNMGGPDRLSRVDMAHKVAAARGHDPACIVSVSSSTVNRGVASPPDISMVSAALESALGLHLTPFSTALTEVFAPAGH